MEDRILLVDDDPEIVGMLRRGLGFEGYALLTAESGEEALEKLQAEPVDLVLLDLMLPGIDGLEVCRRLRLTSEIPVVILTAKRAVTDKVAGFESGADDYLIKPFAFDELVARMKALLRRRQSSHNTSSTSLVHFRDIALDSAGRRVWRGEREIELAVKEFDILELLLRHPRQVLPRDTIYAQVWGRDFERESNLIDVYMRYLRCKLEANGEPHLIHTVRGVGYVLRDA